MISQAAPFRRITRFRKEIDAAIARVVGSSDGVPGQQVESFEREFAAYCELSQCAGTASDTDAVSLALRALGVEPGNEAVTTALTALATAQAIVQLRAIPRFVDVDAPTRYIDRTKSHVVLFGIGSPILVDYEESLHRVGETIAAGVKNYDGATYLPDGVTMVAPGEIGDDLKALPYLAPLFTPAYRVVAVREATKLGLVPREALVDPTSIMPRRVTFGMGSYVNAGCCLGSRSRFGDFTLINRGVTIGHDAVFGSFVSTGPGTVVAGNVTIGDRTMLGAGCTVLPEITIGADAVIGAGAVVTRDVPANCLALGNPARVVREDLGKGPVE